MLTCKSSIVREAFQFSASLRLPSVLNKNHKAKAELIEDLIESLGLKEKAQVQVKRLSYSEKKKVSIGVELAILPNVLFLDEYGYLLGAYETWELTALLKSIAKKCVVICSVSQPPSEVFMEFSRICLLNQGHLIYQGLSSDLTKFFASKGYPCPEGFNPADFALMCIRNSSLETFTGANLETGLSKSSAALSLQDPISMNLKASGTNSYQRSYIYQTLLLLQREARSVKRDPRYLIARLVSTSLLIVLCAVVFLNEGNVNNPLYFIGSHFGSFVFPFFASCFGVMTTTVFLTDDNKPTFIREASSYFYGYIPHAISRLLPELIINFIVSVLTVLILYWSVGWHGNFMMIVLSLFLLLESCTSYAVFLKRFVAVFLLSLMRFLFHLLFQETCYSSTLLA